MGQEFCARTRFLYQMGFWNTYPSNFFLPVKFYEFKNFLKLKTKKNNFLIGEGGEITPPAHRIKIRDGARK